MRAFQTVWPDLLVHDVILLSLIACSHVQLSVYCDAMQSAIEAHSPMLLTTQWKLELYLIVSLHQCGCLFDIEIQILTSTFVAILRALMIHIDKLL